MDKKILNLLCRSFDDQLNQKEKQLLEEALKKSENLRQEKEKIEAQRQALKEIPRSSFKAFFAERVMNRIESLGEKKNGLEMFHETLMTVFRRFAVVGALILLLLIVYNLRVGDSLSADEIFYVSDAAFEEFLNLPLF
jgi:hypothetical protein